MLKDCHCIPRSRHCNSNDCMGLPWTCNNQYSNKNCPYPSLSLSLYIYIYIYIYRARALLAPLLSAPDYIYIYIYPIKSQGRDQGDNLWGI